jgi:eukaryotic-like serine/threonine-protein kinase
LKPQVGQTLDGRFLLTDVIGRGGMATIFKAKDLENDSAPVVVKVPLPIFASGAGSWSIFQHEEEIGRRLDHPNILKFLALAPDKHRSYIVTEFVAGASLASRLKGHVCLPEREALSIASQICDALDYVHGIGVVHYDLKPDNVMLRPDGTIRLIDFGLAHTAVTTRFAFSGPAVALGSADYVAPEQIARKRGRKSVDIYGVGAMLYEMLTGRPPFPGDDPFVVASVRVLGDPPAPRSLNPNISRQAEDIVLRALRRNPAERYASAVAMKADLDHPERMTVVGLSDRLEPVTRWRRWRRMARYVATVGILPIVVQVVLFGLLWHHFARKR